MGDMQHQFFEHSTLIEELRIRSFLVIFCLLTILVLTTCSEKPEKIPILITIDSAADDITSTTALLKGEIQSTGTMKIIEYGIEISENILFTQPVTKGYNDPAVTGKYQVEFTNLKPATLYYYKAYVLINTAQVYSRNSKSFTTKTSGK